MKIRELTEICEMEEDRKQSFEMVIHNISYCKLSAYRQGPVDCKYLSDKPDHNLLYECQKELCLQNKYDPNLKDNYELN